jgi:hypothetical protein
LSDKSDEGVWVKEFFSQKAQGSRTVAFVLPTWWRTFRCDARLCWLRYLAIK